MITNRDATIDRDSAAQALYRAELALHDAHCSHVDEWIRSASERLHVAIERYLAAAATS